MAKWSETGDRPPSNRPAAAHPNPETRAPRADAYRLIARSPGAWAPAHGSPQRTAHRLNDGPTPRAN